MTKVCVLGANGFVGKNLLRDTNWVGVTRQDLDLTNQQAVQEYFNKHQYDVVIHCAVTGGSRLKVDGGDVMYKNVLMFENVVRVFKGKLIYFSSGASLSGTPPTDPYGLSKWIIDRRIETIPDAYSLRIWGCYGPGELSTRFSAVCKNKGHVIIERDRYFDFVDVEHVKEVVHKYVTGDCTDKEFNLVYPEKLLLSQWAERFGATYEIKDTSQLDKSYCFINPYKED
jgi:nucleoside-diphosphate-sugar epimerase